MKKLLFFIFCAATYNSLMSQTFDYAQSEKQAGHRLLEIEKLVALDSDQQTKVYQSCLDLQLKLDSALYFENAPKVYIQKCDDANKEFNSSFFSALTNSQILDYVKLKGDADVKRKAKDKINTLKLSGQYSDEELDAKYNEIYNYLMMEKVVYTRDKYDIENQKENIFRLKALEPNSMKEADARHKLGAEGANPIRQNQVAKIN